MKKDPLVKTARWRHGEEMARKEGMDNHSNVFEESKFWLMKKKPLMIRRVMLPSSCFGLNSHCLVALPGAELPEGCYLPPFCNVSGSPISNSALQTTV